MGSADARLPTTWNRYSYVSGDPTNKQDPTGLCDLTLAGLSQNAANSPGFQDFADNSGAISVYGYSNHSDTSTLLSKLGSVFAGIAQAAAQAFGPNSSTYAGVLGLELAAADGQPINVAAYSGGAAVLTSAVSFLKSQGSAGQSVVGLINQITYVAPGNVGPLYDNGNVSVIGGGLVNGIVGAAAGIPSGATRYTDQNNCGHSFACLAAEFPDAFAHGDACSNPVIVNQNLRTVPRYGDQFYWLNIGFDQMNRSAHAGTEGVAGQ